MQNGSETLTQGLIKLIRRKPVSAEDLEKTALFTLDAIANMIAGRNSDQGRKLLEWGKNRMTDTGRRALIMGGLTHILEVDDVHRASVVHTGAVTVPAVFALAAGQDIPGEKILRAVLYGFESTCRVGMAVGPAHYRVWHNTATCGPYGSAMAAATMLDLDDDQTMHALGNAGTQSGGVWEFLKTGAMSKHLHAGRAAEAGVVAAELAALGFTGPPAILEGPTGFFAAACPDPDPEAVLREPEAPWQVHLTSIKPWPSCRHTHPVIDASLALAGQIDLSQVALIDVATYAAALDVCDRPVAASDYEAKFSLQHCAAAALQRGKMDFAAFGEEARNDAAPLAAKVRVSASEPYATSYPTAWGAGITVEMMDGTRVESVKAECKGDPEAALSADDMITKARDLLRYAGVNDSAGVIDGVLGMPDGGSAPDLTSFFASAA
jgi:2-methylcitrate dehydratase PrpD